MSLVSSERREHSAPWLRTAVFALDRWLRWREGVYEYTDDPDCIFRIQRLTATQELTFADGTHVVPGDPMLKLHIWNEQLPPIAAEDSSLAWARHLGRAIDFSLGKLTYYLQERPELKDVQAICADMRLRTDEQSKHLTRLSGRYGFEETAETTPARPDPLRRLGENILGLLLVLASNPAAARLAILARTSTVVYLSRATLEKRHLKPRRDRVGADETGLPLSLPNEARHDAR